jgi:hypothetical protein
MSASATALAGPPTRWRVPTRVRAAGAMLGASVLGAAPHVLHHVGPLAGAALLAGATGKLLFGALGFMVAVPLLRRLRRRTGSWALPGTVLALMAVAFSFSSFVIGPALTGSDDEPVPAPSASPTETGPATLDQSSQPNPDEHGSHHP